MIAIISAVFFSAILSRFVIASNNNKINETKPSNEINTLATKMKTRFPSASPKAITYARTVGPKLTMRNICAIRKPSQIPTKL